jgi:hypothetical protein
MVEAREECVLLVEDEERSEFKFKFLIVGINEVVDINVPERKAESPLGIGKTMSDTVDNDDALGGVRVCQLVPIVAKPQRVVGHRSGKGAVGVERAGNLGGVFGLFAGT